jgi:hypothetical protein
VIDFRLSVEALGNTRFGYSPLAEVAASLRLLATPSPGFVMQPWLSVIAGRAGRGARGRLQAASDADEQTRILQDADKVLAKDVAYIPIDTAVFYFLHGSGVENYLNTAASNGFADLGPIGVK